MAESRHTVDIYCLKCGEYMHSDRPMFNEHTPAKDRICKKCKAKKQ